MAKAQTMKPKSSFADFFRRLTSPKPKALSRPSSAQSSTMTNLQAAGGPNTKGQAARAAAAPARKPAKAAKAAGWTLASFRLPGIGTKPLTSQLQILGTLAPA